MEFALVLGMALMGFMVPEFFAFISGRAAPLGQNLLMMAAFALIASYFAFR